MLALLLGSLCICVTASAAKGDLFVLVQVGGWEGGLRVPGLFPRHPPLPQFPANRTKWGDVGV